MTLTELRYIVAVAKAKHFGKAAEICFVSQPTLSVGIRKLEDSLGITIFERGRAEVKITPIGELIIKQAEQVLNETNVIKSIAEAEKDQFKKPVRIGSTYTIGKYLFPELIRKAYNLEPKLSFLFIQDYQEQLLEKLEQQELDILLLPTSKINTEVGSDNFNEDSSLEVGKNNSEHLKDTTEKNKASKDIKDIRGIREFKENIYFYPVVNENLYLLAAHSSSYSNKANVALDDIDVKDLYLLNKQHCLHQQLIDLVPNWNSASDEIIQYDFDSLDLLHQVIIQNNAATIVPESFRNDLDVNKDDLVNFIPFADPKPNRDINLVWRNDFTRTQVVDILKQCF